MGWFDGTSSVSRDGWVRSSASRDGWVRKRSPQRPSIYSTRHSRHSAPSIFSFGGAHNSRNRSTGSFFSTSSSSSRRGVRPRSGFVDRLVRRIRRLLRDIYNYARRHPIRVFLFVLVPLIAAGLLQRLLAMIGLRMPAGLMGPRSEFEQISREVGNGGGGFSESLNGWMAVARMLL